MRLFNKKNKFFISLFSMTAPCALFAETEDQGIETLFVEGSQYTIELEREQRLTPGGVTLIDGEDSFQRNVTNLADMFRFVPGLWAASGSTGDGAFLSIRGSNLDATAYDGNGIKLSVDGLPVTAADGNNHNRDVDPLSARYAVVARGANALAYGASTLGGAIDFISPTARDTPSHIFVNAGSFGQRQTQLLGSGVKGDMDGLIALDARKWEGFRKNQQAQERLGLYANAGWTLNDSTQTRFYVNWIDNDQEIPGALTRAQFDEDPYQANPSNVVGNFQVDVQTSRIANKTTWAISDSSDLWGGLSYEVQSLYHPIVYNPYFSLLIDTDQKNTGAAARYNLRSEQHDLLVGINYGQTTVEGGNYRHEAGTKTSLMTIVDNNADSLELFLLDRWRFADRWTLVYGAQAVVASREVRNTNVDTEALYNPAGDYESINPRVGMLYSLTETNELYSNLSRLYEPPTTYQLEDDMSSDGQALAAMTGEVFEIGTRGVSAISEQSYLRWEVSAYYAQIEDEILSIDDPEAPGTSLSTNVDNTIHAGIEALFAASVSLSEGAAHRLEPTLNLTLNEFHFQDDARYGDHQLPVAPQYALKGELLYRHSGGFYVGPTFDVVGARYADFANTYEVDGYTLWGLRAGVTKSHWELYVDARNISDEAYVSVFSVKDYATEDAAILQAGEPQAFYVGVKWTL